ncbi:MAG TPA: alpha/beta hydrolase [Candidatus Binatus sp.]|nr:alpha/beta hydrolase [Candidatus Binatus sp.]
MRSGTFRFVATAAAVVLVAAACGGPSPTPASTAAPSLQTIGPSPSPTAGPASSTGPTALSWSPSGLAQTAELVVPLAPANPSVGTITLTIARRLAADPAHRFGALFGNPGGPGGSGVGIPGQPTLDRVIPQAILDRFDIVSWDPRGVGQSHGLTCPDTATATAIERLSPDPRTAADIGAYKTSFDALAAQCQATAGDLLPYLAEANTARDMDAIRAALGETTVSYLGWSYGTYLGYLYARLFPSHLRAAVLDGPVNPALDLAGRDASQARGFELAFEHFLATCAAASQCPFHGGDDPAKAYDALIAKLERTPQGNYLNAGQAVLGTLAWLYGRDVPGLATALANTASGDGSMLRQAADSFFTDVSFGAYEAATCLDIPHPTSQSAIAVAAAAARQVSPRFGPSVALSDQYGCLDWPVPGPSTGPAPSPLSGLPPILVVAGRWDPATPPWDPPILAKALGSGVVLMRDGLGHTSGESATTDACLRGALVSYLVDGDVPPVGTVCTDGPAFSWP